MFGAPLHAKLAADQGGKTMKSIFSAVVFGLAMTSAAWAEDACTYPFDVSFDDATFAVESAIVGRSPLGRRE